MSESLNVNVLVAAKEEYTKQLVFILSTEIYDSIYMIYKDSQQMKKKRDVSLKNFQLLLKRIPLWNSILINKYTVHIKNKIPYLTDLITAIFVSHVKILSSVRLNTDHKSIKVRVPNIDIFLHKIIITIAEKIYYKPDIIQDKKENVIHLITDTIEESISNQIPIDNLLTGVFDNDINNSDNNISNNESKEDESEKSNESDESEKSNESDESDESEEEDESEDEESNIKLNDKEQEIINIPTIPIKELKQKNKVIFDDAIEKLDDINDKISDNDLSDDD